MSFDAYLRFSEQEESRYEYIGGFAYAMSGGTPAHHDIGLNIAVVLRARTRGTPCRTYHQGFRVRTPRGDVYYPDVMVSCGRRPSNDALDLEDPCLVVEVLSPSTARTDLGEKRFAYQEIPMLHAYLVVEPTWRAVHRHWRDDAGQWRRETISGASGIVTLPCPAGATLTLDEIYEDVEVPNEPPRPRRVFEQPETTTAGAS
jgi:Uma2 family endonuclease